MLASVPESREPRRGHLEQLTRLEQLLERDMALLREQVEAGSQELRHVGRGRSGDVAAARATLRRADQVLRRQQPQRFTHGRAADAVLPRELALDRKPLTAAE